MRFFQFYNVIECQKVNLAAAYRNDIADSWYQGWSKMRIETNWTEFVEDLCVRFGERSTANVIEEFNKLKQEGWVMEYYIRFEELRSLLLNSHPTLTEPCFVSSFISGLNKELRPTSLGQR